MSTVKEQAQNLVAKLPEDATWEDLMYRIYVRQQIVAGQKDIEEGRCLEHEEAKKRLLGR